MTAQRQPSAAPALRARLPPAGAGRGGADGADGCPRPGVLGHRSGVPFGSLSSMRKLEEPVDAREMLFRTRASTCLGTMWSRPRSVPTGGCGKPYSNVLRSSSARRNANAASVSDGFAAGIVGNTETSQAYRFRYASKRSDASTTPEPSPLIRSVPPA